MIRYMTAICWRRVTVYMLLRVVVLPVGHQTTRPASSPRCCVRPDTNSDTDTDMIEEPVFSYENTVFSYDETFG